MAPLVSADDICARNSNGSRRSSPGLSWKHPPPPHQDNGEKGPPELTLAPSIGGAAIAAMSFFNVSGGPWGSEDIFSASDPATGVAGIIFFAVCFCVPQILVTAELSCALPSNGGYSIWVREAFGDFWCFQETYWQWVSGVADAAVYPVLICDTVLQLLDRTHVGMVEKIAWRAMTAALLSLPTYVSISRVPSLLITLAVCTGAPVVAFVLYGLRFFDPAVMYARRTKGPIRYGKFLNVLFWNLEGWDCISTCTALCAEPRERTIPRGLFVAMVATTVQYVLVLVLAAGVSEESYPWESWNDGTLPSIGRTVGPWMSALLLGASVAGNAGQYLSEFMEDSYLLQGAAEVRIVPRFLGKTLPLSGVPWMANTAQLLIIIVLMSFDFSDILVFDNFFCATAMALEFLAYFKLRWHRPDLPRPFRTPTACLPLFIPALMVLVLVWVHCLSGDARCINLGALAVGVPYGLWVAATSRREHEEGHRSGLDHLVEDD